MKKITVQEMILCALFTALIAVGAFIKVPIPMVPFTLQFLFTTLAGLLLGRKLGAISVLTYVILGLVGLPIFAEGGGISYILKPSFGYLIGFILGAYIVGTIINNISKPSIKRLLIGNFLGLAVVYICGMAYFYIICNYVISTPIGFWPMVFYCFVLAVPGDIVLSILAAILAKRLIPALGKMRLRKSEKSYEIR